MHKPKSRPTYFAQHYRFNIVALILIAGALVSYVILRVVFSRAATGNADFNSDGIVNILDLSILAAHYNQTGVTQPQGDANADGIVNISDLSVLASQWGVVAAYIRPFGPTAPWNVPVAGLATSPNSALYVAHLWDGSPHPGELHTYTDGYTYPVYDIAGATMTVPVNVLNPTWGSNLVGKTIPWNPGWQPAAGTDAQVILIDPPTGREWDLWETSFNGSTLTIGNGSLVPGSYWTNTTGFIGSRGAGIMYLAMLVRPQEVSQGLIPHALSMPMGTISSSFVAPATKSDASGGVVPMGTRLAIHVTDAQIDSWVSSLPLSAVGKTSARTIAVALRDYGMFVDDNGGQATVQLEDVKSAAAQWQALGLQEQTINGVDYPNHLLDGLVNSSNLYAIVPSDQY